MVNEYCERCAYNDEGSCSCFDRESIDCPIARDELEKEKDINFFTDIIHQICTYANENDMTPDETLRTVSNNILALLEISTFNNMK